MTIIITMGLAGFHAQLENRPEISGYGLSADGAMGNLVTTHQSLFNIEVMERPTKSATTSK